MYSTLENARSTMRRVGPEPGERPRSARHHLRSVRWHRIVATDIRSPAAAFSMRAFSSSPFPVFGVVVVVWCGAPVLLLAGTRRTFERGRAASGQRLVFS